MRHNLVAPPPGFVEDCQVVFLRNVLIYFSADHARTFLRRLAGALAPGAVLFLGGAESLWQVTDRFRAVRLGDSFVYERCDPSRGSQARRTASKGRSPVHRTPAPSSTRPPVEGSRPAPAAPLVEEPVRSRAAELADAGQTALAVGDHAAAVVAFRQWAYLAPDDPLASLHLGLALEAGGHHMPARRAYGVSRAVMHRIGPDGADVALGGYATEELVRLLDSKQQSGRKGTPG
jgi:chemotaxis protein methyltransferase CheR